MQRTRTVESKTKPENRSIRHIILAGIAPCYFERPVFPGSRFSREAGSTRANPAHVSVPWRSGPRVGPMVIRPTRIVGRGRAPADGGAHARAESPPRAHSCPVTSSGRRRRRPHAGFWGVRV